MSIGLRKPMVWGFRASMIKEMFSPSELYETNRLIARLKILLSNAGEHGCFMNSAQTNDVSGVQRLPMQTHNI